MFRRLSNILLPALLALLTVLPAAGMVLRPCAEGALPVQAFANLSDAQPSAFSLQPSDFSLPNSSFSLANSQNCANDPVNGWDPEGAWNLWNPATWGDGNSVAWSLEDSLNPIHESAGWHGFGEGFVGGSAIVGDAFTFGTINRLHNAAAQYQGAEYFASRIMATVSREAAIYAATGGIGKLAQAGSRTAQFAQKGILLAEAGTGGYQAGQGINRIREGDVSGGAIDILGGGLRVLGSGLNARQMSKWAVEKPATEFAGGTQSWVDDLSHVTGKTATSRDRTINAIINEDLGNLKLTYKPQYSPFIRTGVAQKGFGTQIGQNMFGSRAALRDTIIHEELHHRWWARGIYDHHPAGSVLEAKFYKTVARYKRMRGWAEP